MNELEYMKLALELAKKGTGHVSPNPLVGAVIVKDGRIIGEGYHEKYGQPHAERNALAHCTESPEGADIYVTLEPCCHHGKQPPCTDAIIEAGIKRVIVGSPDPNPLVAGKGIQILKNHGIAVDEHVLEDECLQLNDVFFHFIRTKTPFVAMKFATTIDGKIAAYTGKSQWITGEAARNHAHGLRNRYSAIMVGVGTVEADNPMLTCRIEGGRNPIRIICDSKLGISMDSNIVNTSSEVPTIIATVSDDSEKISALEKAGCEILKTEALNGRVSLTDLMKKLGEKNIDSILVEGGGTLNWSILEAGLANKVYAYVSPMILGGKTAKSPVEGIGFTEPDAGITLKNTRITELGKDYLIEGEV